MDNIQYLYTSTFMIGAFHALQPSHGQALVMGAVIGTRYRWLDVVRLGFVTASGHTATMLLIAVVSFLCTEWLASAEIRSDLTTGIGVVVTALGLFMLVRAIVSLLNKTPHAHACRADHVCNSKESGTTLSATALMVGLIPCPGSLALAFSALGAGSLAGAAGRALLFGLGAACSLSLLGLALTHSPARLTSHRLFAGARRYSSALAAILLFGMGLSVLFHTHQHDSHESAALEATAAP